MAQNEKSHLFKPQTSQTINPDLVKRNKTVDVVRIIASFGVIAIHAKSDTPSAGLFSYLFWPVCVPFFLMASLFYYQKSLLKESGLKPNLLKIAQRLYIPFIAWSVIYLILLLVKHRLEHQNKSFSIWNLFIYGSSSVQMYFQPLLINIQLLVLGGFLFYHKKLLPAIVLISGTLIFFIIGDIYNCFGFSSSGQYLIIATFILFAYVLVRIVSLEGIERRLLFAGLIVLSITYLSLLIPKLNITIDGYWIFFPFGGIGLMLICFGYNISNLPKWVEALSNNTYGIYLSHIVFLEMFELISTRLFANGLEYNLVNKILFVTCVFIASNVFVSIIRRWKYFRIVFLGEK